VHKGLYVPNRDFDALVQNLGKILSKFKVPAREQKELVAPLARCVTTSAGINLTHS
jgi:hemoglobin